MGDLEHEYFTQYKQGCDSCHVYCTGGKYGLKGSADLSPMFCDESSLWYFNRLFVYSSYRKQGIGSTLLDMAIKWADEHSFTVVCDVSGYGEMTNDELIQFYCKHGFVHYDNDPEFRLVYKGGTFDEWKDSNM